MRPSPVRRFSYSTIAWYEQIESFVETNSILILNVARPRSSIAPGIEQFVNKVLDEALRLTRRSS